MISENKSEDMLREYFSADRKTLAFKKKPRRAPYFAAAALVFALSLGAVFFFTLNNEPNKSAYIGGEKVALSSVDSYTCLMVTDEEISTRVGLIRMRREDLVYIRAKTESGEGKFFARGVDFCKEESLTPDVELVNSEPTKEKVESVEKMYSLYFEEDTGLYGFRPKDFGKGGFTLGFYNTKKTDDLIELTVVYSDGTQSICHIDVNYTQGTSLEEELTMKYSR